MVAVDILDELAEMLAKANPRQVLNFKPAPQNLKELEGLLLKKSAGQLTYAEERELDKYVLIENVLGLAKARAYQILQNEPLHP